MKTLPPNVIGPIVSSDVFSWFRGNGTTELSDHRCNLVGSQLYSDAADCGFVVRSERTGDLMIFVFDSIDWGHPTEHDEVAGWIFYSTDRRVKITVIND